MKMYGTIIIIIFFNSSLIAQRNQSKFLHISATSDKIKLALDGIWLAADTLLFNCSITNTSVIDYHPAWIRFSLQDKHRNKRTAQQEIAVEPVRPVSALTVSGHEQRQLSFAFTPFMIPKRKKLKIEMAEENGARSIQLLVTARKLLRARRVLTN
jgi:hypothetical protein